MRYLSLLVIAFCATAHAAGFTVTSGGTVVAPPSNFVAPAGQGVAAETSSAMNFYIATTGNDSNTCAAIGQECLTIQGAVAKIPKGVNHVVSLSCGTGSFAGAYFSGFHFGPNGYIDLRGTNIAATIAGLQAGTVTSATAGDDYISPPQFSTLTKTAAGWTPGALAGLMVAITGGAGIGGIREIQTNTATMITTVGEWDSDLGTPDGTSTFAILDWGTILSSGVDSINTPIMSSYTTYYPTYGSLVTVGNSAGEHYGHGGFFFRDLKVTTVANQAVLVMDNSSVSLVRVNSTNGSLIRTSYAAGGNVNVRDCYAIDSGTFVPLVDAQGLSGTVSVQTSFFSGGGSVVAPTTSSSTVYFYDNFVTGTAHAVLLFTGVQSAQSLGNIMTGCGGCYSFGDSNGFSFGALDVAYDVCSSSTTYHWAVTVSGHGAVGLYGLTGTANAGGVKVLDGGTALLTSSNVTVTGTLGDLSIDGNAYTYTAFWLLTPINLTSTNTGARIYAPPSI